MDQKVGLMEKMEAHEKGLLHRAFSIFIFNSKGELLIHQRAMSKYHSPGLWTNTCCSHPRDTETLQQAVNRRLEEEMGMATDMEKKFHFIYKAELDQGLTEHELDHVFFGHTDDLPKPNPEEVMDFKYVNIEELTSDMEQNPDNYTEWFKICFPEVLKNIRA
ncbi:MAG: isopentenyl-diphosphate Delta-isomerase [Flavobacteriales bacterium]|nr:isopentenyl-diphosphate Delta-isomerase [Flavobacteriales bacterium]